MVNKLRANNIELVCETFGNPEHPAVLLIMGLGTQMIAWSEAFCRNLAGGGFHVIRYDNRDTGQSQSMDALGRPRLYRMLLKQWLRLPSRPPYRLRDLAADAIGLLDGLGIDRAHVVGASMGGMVAQHMAADWAERLISLNLIMSSSGDRRLPSADRKVRKLMLRKRPPRTDRAAYIESAVELLVTIGGPHYPRSPEQWRELVGRSFDRGVNPAGFYRQLAAIIEDGDRSELLSRLTQATLVVHGDADVLIPVDHGRDLAEKIPGARLAVIEGMGHDLPPQLTPGIAKLLLQQFARTQSLA